MTVYYSEQAKRAYWGYLEGVTPYRPPRLTERRMAKLRKLLWDDNKFWGDLIYRHGNGESDPRHMEPDVLEHCLGNFYGMLMSEAVRRGMVKP